jgi:protein SCO1/2
VKRQSLIIAFVVFLVIAIGGALFLFRDAGTSPPAPPANPTTTGEALIGGPFSLVAQDGRRVTDGDLKGRFALVYFGYTHCPDMCPLGLETVTRAMELLPPPAAERVQPCSSPSTRRATRPEVMRAYAASFHPRLLALTGSEAEVQGALKAYRVYARKADDAKAGGRVPRRPLDLHLRHGPGRPLPRPLLPRHHARGDGEAAGYLLGEASATS